MTLTEFKYWFNGFCENIEAAPTKEQWDKIKQMINESKNPSVYQQLAPLRGKPINFEQQPPYILNL